ncbi:MAG: diflavin flavoprotein [Pseudanabaenaceae cyanobacterium]
MESSNPIAPVRDVQVYPLAAGTRVWRGRSWSRLRFEIEYALERGTTSNSDLIEGDRPALIDVPGETFTELFLASLRERYDLRQLRYVVVGHINPNRATTLAELLRLAPHLTVVCSNPGEKSLRSLLPGLGVAEFTAWVVRGEAELDLGQGHRLRLAALPIPRYPDGLYAFDEKTAIAYTGKFYCAHLCGDQVLDEGWGSLVEHHRYYFDCVLASQGRAVTTALERLAAWPAQLYGPVHGPVLRYGLGTLQEEYRRWYATQQQQNLRVVVLYASAYGKTATMADAIARGLIKAEIAVEMLDCEQSSPAEIQAAVERAAGFILGSPTLGGHVPTQVETALGIVLAHGSRGSLAGVFGSYGWSGEAVDILATKLKDGGFVLGFPPLRHKFTPTAEALQICEEAGTAFARELKRVKKVRTTFVPASSVEQAVGRVVGSLCVVTARRGDLTNAMLASWVSQGTFNPPGLTVSVAKDRAIESWMHAGDSFVLNILPQGSTLARQFMKKYAPGQDRLAGIATAETENGNPLLAESLAYVECRVAQRMECGDHWLVYAIAERGKVLQEGLTAIHHRKSGGHY